MKEKPLAAIQLGLRQNWQQFVLLIVVNAFVGAMVGLERTVVPLLAEEAFGLVSRTITLSFLISFGVVKAITNLFAGRLGDKIGRKPVLIAGWVIGLPVPILIILAPSWGWVVFANVLLGVNQGLCWSTTVIMKIDLVGPKQRGLAMGLNEFAGYLAVSLAALGSGYLAASYGVRPFPFYPGIIFAIFGLLFSLFFVGETRPFAQLEAKSSTTPTAKKDDQPSFTKILLLTSWQDKTLFSISQAGMVNNLNDGMVWGLLPLFLIGFDMSLEQIAVLAATYPGVWGVGQLFTGALSDRWGRKWLIATGMWTQAAGIGLIVIGRSFGVWLGGVILLGLGTAMVYPTLLAAISDVAHPEWRGSAVGVYRLWRDGGYAVGALLAGLLADALGIPTAIAAIGGLTMLAGFVVAGVMNETLPQHDGDS
ncbi:MAG: MFS transporter [Ardenticatenaceae bacterium]|nr:MFS transporter [Ardenticatenaceae bacterium]